MKDIGHEETEKVLASLEKRLAKEYAQAYKEVEKKASDYFSKFKKKDKEKKKLVDEGKLSENEYQTWRKNQMLSGKRWTDLRDQLAKDLTNTNQIAAAIVRGELNEVFAINANYSEYLIENGMRTNYGFTLYDKKAVANLVENDPDIIPWKPVVDVPADLRWNRQMITGHITQGILQGESVPNLSKRLVKTVNNDKVAAVRTARTAVTSSQNAGRQMVYDNAKKMGLKLQKEWLATLDGRTRHEHGAVDGQKVPLDGEFTVGGYKMKFPGDMSAPAHLVYNCFVGETKVASNSKVVRSYKHLYEGDLIKVKTSGGVEFSCTPNHPILTPFGWVVANRLNEGDNILVTFGSDDTILGLDGNINHVHPSMEAFHNSFKSMRTACRDTSLSVNFHGDIPTTDVEIITQKRLLWHYRNSNVRKRLRKFFFKLSDTLILNKSHFMKCFRRVWQASLSFIRTKCKPFPFLRRSVSHSDIHGCRPSPNRDMVLVEYPIDNLPTETMVRSELLDGLSGKVFVDKILSVKVVPAKCHVYNLQTENGYYFVNSSIPQNGEKSIGIFAISKNCRCTTITVEPDYITKGEEPRMTYNEWVETKEGKDAIQKKKDKAKEKQNKKSGDKDNEKFAKGKIKGYTQKELEKLYNSVETMWDMTPQERYALANTISIDIANSENFFNNSVGFWELKKSAPRRDADYISYSRRTGKVSSKYWYDENGVYRQSDHWGSDVASCSWYIDGRTYKNEGVIVGKKETAFIKWEDLKAKGMITKHYQTGEYGLSGFKFEK